MLMGATNETWTYQADGDQGTYVVRITPEPLTTTSGVKILYDIDRKTRHVNTAKGRKNEGHGSSDSEVHGQIAGAYPQEGTAAAPRFLPRREDSGEPRASNPARHTYSDLSEAMSMEKRYFTSDLSSLS